MTNKNRFTSSDLDTSASMVIEAMKSQLLLILVNRLGGKVTIPIAEIDDFPVGKALTLAIDQKEKTFTFKVLTKKQSND